MSLNFFSSLNGVTGVLLAAAGTGIMTSAASSVNALSVKSPTQAGSFELAGQPSASQMNKDEQTAEDDIKLLPEAITDAVFKEVSQQSGMQASQLRIVEVARQTWSDGCLGLGGSDTLCTQSLVPGWRVTVASGEQRWVYRTNESGSLVKLDEMASLTAADATAQLTRQQVTTRTTQTTQSVTSTTNNASRSSQSTQAATATSSSESRATQASQGSVDREQQSMTASRQAQVSQNIQTSFTDVSSNYWAMGFIAELASKQIIEGFPDGKFHPNEPVTRAQFAAMISKAFKKNKVRNAINFRDISTNYWAYSAIREAYEMGFLGIASGNEFNPSRSLTRLDILMALTKGMDYSFTGSTTSVLGIYNDVATIPSDVRSVIAAATQRGLVVNYPNVKSLSLNTVATRAEVAAFIYQALVSKGEMTEIPSPYVVGGEVSAPEVGAPEVNAPEVDAPEVSAPEVGAPEVNGPEAGEAEVGKPARQNCNQGIGNGAEGCDPGNSMPHGGSNDEGGRTPGNRPPK